MKSVADIVYEPNHSDNELIKRKPKQYKHFSEFDAGFCQFPKNEQAYHNSIQQYKVGDYVEVFDNRNGRLYTAIVLEILTCHHEYKLDIFDVVFNGEHMFASAD